MPRDRYKDQRDQRAFGTNVISSKSKYIMTCYPNELFDWIADQAIAKGISFSRYVREAMQEHKNGKSGLMPK